MDNVMTEDTYQALIPTGNSTQNDSPVVVNKDITARLDEVVLTLKSIALEPSAAEQYRLAREAYATLGNIIIPVLRSAKVQHNFAMNNQPRRSNIEPISAGADPTFGVPIV